MQMCSAGSAYLQQHIIRTLEGSIDQSYRPLPSLIEHPNAVSFPPVLSARLSSLAALGCVTSVSNVRHLHDNGTLLTPDALGGVLGLHVGGHAILHGARDVPLDHVGAVVPGKQRGHRGFHMFTRDRPSIAGRSDNLGSVTLATGEKVLFKSMTALPAFNVSQMYEFSKRDGCHFPARDDLNHS